MKNHEQAEILRTRLGDYVRMITKPSKGQDMFVCPLCHSGQNRNHTGAFHLSEDVGKWYCHSCGEGGDIFSLYALLNRKDLTEDFPEIIEELSKLLGVTDLRGIEKRTYPTLKTESFEMTAEEKAKRFAAIQEFASQISGSPAEEYLHSRGFSDETISKYQLGYDPRMNAVVIPYPNEAYYTKRLIAPSEDQDKYDNLRGEAPTFKIKNSDSDLYYITEGQLDAISLIQVGAQNVIASKYQKKLDALLCSVAIKGAAIIADRDEPDAKGRKAGDEIAKKLLAFFESKGIPAIVKYPPEGYKDSNDLLAKNPEELRKMLKEVSGDLKTLLNNSTAKPITTTTADGKIHVVEEHQKPQLVWGGTLEEMDIPPIRWIVPELLPVGLSMLAAPSKYFKSYLSLDLCASVAAGSLFLGRQTVQSFALYADLESTLRRPQSRLRQILNGEPFPEKLAFLTANDLPSLGTLGNGFEDSLLSILDTYPEMRLIVIDVFQLIRPKRKGKGDLYAMDYAELQSLKKIADERDTAILLVHHLRKMQDSDPFNMLSGSVGIMGALDSAWVITKQDRFSDEAKLSITGRDLESRELSIRWNKSAFRWELLGDAEQVEEARRQKEFSENPIVKIISDTLSTFNGEWSGTVAELIKNSHYYNGGKNQICDSPQSVGRFLKSHHRDFQRIGINIEDVREAGTGKRFLKMKSI